MYTLNSLSIDGKLNITPLYFAILPQTLLWSTVKLQTKETLGTVTSAATCERGCPLLRGLKCVKTVGNTIIIWDIENCPLCVAQYLCGCIIRRSTVSMYTINACILIGNSFIKIMGQKK